MDFIEYLKEKNKGFYDRDNYDSFLQKKKFKFTVPSIHITGSNGKGSTATYLANIYKNAGYKVGLYTSPYSVSPTEMIKINGEEIDPSTFEKILLDNKKEIEKFELSEFEIETFIAFTYFMNEKCDIAVIECGMGGEIDATNIFDPVLSIITSISLEHTNYLGRSLSEIALQKAGIIKLQIPVLIDNRIKGDALDVLTSEAKRNKTKISTLYDYSFVELLPDGYKFFYGGYKDLFIPTRAEYSIKDACFAIEATAILKEQFPINEEAVRTALKETRLKARLEVKSQNPLVIVDGAHNVEAIQTLIREMDKISENKPIHTVFAAFKDKNVSNMLSDLSVLSSDITLTTFDHKRARKEEEYFLYLEEYRFEQDYKKAIQDLMDQYPEDIILVTGSLAFAFLVSGDFDNEIFIKK